MAATEVWEEWAVSSTEYQFAGSMVNPMMQGGMGGMGMGGMGGGMGMGGMGKTFREISRFSRNGWRWLGLASPDAHAEDDADDERRWRRNGQ